MSLWLKLLELFVSFSQIGYDFHEIVFLSEQNIGRKKIEKKAVSREELFVTEK